MELVVEGNVYYNGKLVQCCVGIEDQKIAAVKKVLRGERHLDFGYKLILPAGIDVHVHFRDPGATYKENFETGSLSAAFGGMSCVFDMPNTEPKVDSVRHFDEKLNAISTKAWVDFGLYADAMSAELDELAGRASGFKLFMNECDDWADGLARLRRTDSVIAVHAEAKARIKKDDKPGLKAHLRSREDAERIALESLVPLDGLHICHISAKESVAILQAQASARSDRKMARGADDTTSQLISNDGDERVRPRVKERTVEVTPHHLMLNVSSGPGSLCRVNPPLRGREDNLALWDALNAGVIDMLASDHAPHTLEDKAALASGIPGVETCLPLMFYQLKHKHITLPRLVNAISEKPAELFGLNKGRILEGYDADLVVVDLRAEKRINAGRLHSKCGWTPFEGFSAIFPRATIVRGALVIKDEAVFGAPGFGGFVSYQKLKGIKR